MENFSKPEIGLHCYEISSKHFRMGNACHSNSNSNNSTRVARLACRERTRRLDSERSKCSLEGKETAEKLYSRDGVLHIFEHFGRTNLRFEVYVVYGVRIIVYYTYCARLMRSRRARSNAQRRALRTERPPGDVARNENGTGQAAASARRAIEQSCRTIFE